VTIGIDVHGEGVGTNGGHENATDKRVLVRSSAGDNPADGNHILAAAKTRIADVNIIAANAGIGTRASAYGVVEIASAILKRRVAHRTVVASVSIGLQRERAHSGIVGTVVVIDDGGCSKGAVPVLAVLSKRAAVPTAVLESALLRVRAPAPIPVLKLPVEVPNSANQPTPEFLAPLVRF
jgi:hypothetical protein